MEKKYLIIDLKSFYASVECVERHLDPLTTKLVVADAERGLGTICLAVTPALKRMGVKNRCRVYEIPPRLQYLTAPPRMQLYINYAAKIYGIYLRYFAPEDILVYSVDEAFMDATPYLWLYQCTPRELAIRIMADILCITGITATCGIGTNLYLAKIALDIFSKHQPDNIGELDEESYRARLWEHRPLTDFWRIGPGTAAKLAHVGISTMRGIAKADSKLLTKLFGVDAMILQDHAWGREPTTIAEIKAYVPKTRSLTNGQVLPRNYSCAEGRLILLEMASQLALDMVDQHMLTKSITLYLSYAYEAMLPALRLTAKLLEYTNSEQQITTALLALYDNQTDKQAFIRRIVLNANHVIAEQEAEFNLFAGLTPDPSEKERQQAINAIKKRFGKNAIFKGMDLLPAATALIRNRQIGGHKSGTSENFPTI